MLSAAVVDVLRAMAGGDLRASLQGSSSGAVGQIAAALESAQEGLRGPWPRSRPPRTRWRRARRSCRRRRRRSRRRRRRPARSPAWSPGPPRRSRRSVQTVAAGAEEMGASIREIASNAAAASEVAAQGGDRGRDDDGDGGQAG